MLNDLRAWIRAANAPRPPEADSWRHVLPRVLAAISAIAGWIWYLTEHTDRILTAAMVSGICALTIYLAHPLSPTESPDAYERIAIIFGLAFGAVALGSIGWGLLK